MSAKEKEKTKKKIGCPTGCTLRRIGYLADPAVVDKLLDEFQLQGMPLGNDRWAEHCLSRLRELRAKERTLTDIIKAREARNEEAIDRAIKYCGSEFYRRQRQNLTKEFQERSARKEEEDMKLHGYTT